MNMDQICRLHTLERLNQTAPSWGPLSSDSA